MTDLVVTVPKPIWFEWIAEGDAAGESATGTEWGFWLSRARPPIERGDRLYIVAWGRLRGYSPVTRVAQDTNGRWVVCREGGAVAVTIDEEVLGFRGYRKVWWEEHCEKPFSDWKTAAVDRKLIERAIRYGNYVPPRHVDETCLVTGGHRG